MSNTNTTLFFHCNTVLFFLEFFSFNISATENISYLDSLWNKGVTSYSEGNWESSLDAFNSINKAGIVSAELFYNMANSYGLFFNSENGDRVYDADSFSEWLKPFFKNGVFLGGL